MMRIQVHEAKEQLTIQVEGTLGGISTSELENCWRALHAKFKGKIVLDLNGVIRIGSAGRSVLRSMHRDGVCFIGAGLSVQDVLEEIKSDVTDQKDKHSQKD